MYKILYDNVGNIVEFTKVMSHEIKGLNSAVVPEQFTPMLVSVDSGNRPLDEFKVDINSKDTVIIDTRKPVVYLDKQINKIVQIFPKQTDKIDLDIVIQTIDSRPHIVVTSKHEVDRKFSIYLTKKENVNYLYQCFNCETNSTNVFEVDQIDYRKLFNNEFSLYYRKIFNKSGYSIQ